MEEMSYTELFRFTNIGNAHKFAETHNAFRSAMAVWMQIEKKYLPSLPPPSWAYTPEERNKYHSRNVVSIARYGNSEHDPMDDIWNLYKNPDVDFNDKVALVSTFDKAIVMRHNLDKLVTAFDSFTETSLPEQANAIRNLLAKDKTFIAIAWNQTSVNCDTWSNNFGYNKPYNILRQSDHYELFDLLTPAPDKADKIER